MHSSDPSPLTAGMIAVQLLIVFALVLINGFFVASEFALVSVRKTRIDQLAAEGNSSAAVVQAALRDLDRYIAATQVGITIASLLLGGIGERALEPLLHPLFSWLPQGTRGLTSGGMAIGFAYFIMTALHVIIGELMPKSIALQKTERTALIVGRPMTLLAKLFTPLIWMLNGSGNILLRLIGIQAAEGHGQVHSPEELDMIFSQSHEGGALTTTERDLLHRVVKFSDLTAREVMVPRVEMRALPLSISRVELMQYLHGTPHTRTPVYQGSLDEIKGVLHLKDLMRFASSPENRDPADHDQVDLTAMAREVARVPETITIDKLLREFKRRRQQMAIVIDEYGGTAGLVTMGDLLEQVFGDVHDEFDAPEPEVVARTDGRIYVQGRVLIAEINELYGVGFNDEEADTMGGLVFHALGRPAVVGDEVTLSGVNLRVEGVDRLRITELSLLLPEVRNGHEGTRKPAPSATTAASSDAA